MTSTGTDHHRLEPKQMVRLYNGTIGAGETAWQDWIRLGQEIALRRAEASAAANKTKRGPIYSAKLETKLGAFYPIFKKISANGTLVNLDRCLGQLAMVNAFRRSRPEGQAPSNPVAVWTAYKASSFSPIDYDEDEKEPSDIDDTKKTRRRRNRTANELTAEIAELQDQLDGHTMTANAPINADRIWRRMIEARGHDRRTAQLAIDTANELLALGRRVLDGDEPS